MCFFANNSTLGNNTQSLLGSALRWIAYGRTQRKKRKENRKILPTPHPSLLQATAEHFHIMYVCELAQKKIDPKT